jgi:hypothetical protein
MTEIITHSQYRPEPSVKQLYHGSGIVWYVLGLVETLLAFRFLLRLFGANQAAGFTDFIYRATAPLVEPFASATRASRWDEGVAEWSTILAMAVYWLVSWAIVDLFFIAGPVSRYEADEELRRDHDIV